MKKAIITGATGSIGLALIEELINNGVEFLVFCRTDSKRNLNIPKSELVTIKYCSLEDLKTVENDTGKTYDVFYHFAWAGTTGASRNDGYLQNKNVEYTLDAVNVARKFGCQTFIGAGSQAEYGIYKDKIYTSTRVDPIIPYGIAKFAAGKLSRRLCDLYEMTHIWPRIFSVYGVNDNDNTMVKYAIKQFKRANSAEFSAATQNWNYLYEKDAGKIFYLLGDKKIESGVYNVASNDTRPLKDFIYEIWKLCGGKGQCIFSKVSDSNVVSLDPDIAGLIQTIGEIPHTSFAEGIIEVIKSLT